MFSIFTPAIRGEVEDTRLEAKDTKKSEAKASPSEDRLSRGQEQECARPRTQAQVFSKKKDLQKSFQAISSKKRLLKFFFRRSTKFQQFKTKCCPRAEDRAISMT